MRLIGSVGGLLVFAALKTRGVSGAIGACNPVQQDYVIDSTQTALTLSEAVNCTGGSITATWRGTVVLGAPISIGDGTSLTILADVATGRQRRSTVVEPDALELGVGSDGANGGEEEQSVLEVNKFMRHGDSRALQDTAAVAVVDGGGSVQLFTLGIDSSLDLEGMALTRGNSTLTEGGGAIYAPSLGLGQITIKESIVQSNNGTSGGAIYVDGGGKLLAESSSFTGNVGSLRGGAIYATGLSTVTLDGCTFTTNIASGIGGGGAIYTSGAILTMHDTTFASNSAASGSSGGALNIRDASIVVFSGGSCYLNTGYSGGCANSYTSTITVVGVNMTRNAAKGGYGGVWCDELESTVTFDSMPFVSNTASLFGGAIASVSSFSGTTMSITNCEFTRNFCPSKAGAVWSNVGCAMVIENCVFTENSSGSSAGASLSSGLFSYVNNTYLNNYSTNGGAVQARFGRTGYYSNITDCRFIGNYAHVAGGLLLEAITMNLTRLVFESNRATVSDGGAMQLLSVGPSLVKVSCFDCVFTNNSAINAGGSISGTSPDAHPQNLQGSTFSSSVASCCYAGGYGSTTNHSLHASFTCVDIDTGYGRSCCEVNEYQSPNNRCETCPSGYDCTGIGATVASAPLDPGMWRPNLISMDVFTCAEPSACMGGVAVHVVDEYCAKGYEGPYCSVCADNYANVEYKCLECSTTWSAVSLSLSIVALILLAIIAVWITSVLARSGNPNKSKPSAIRRRFEQLPWEKLRTPIVVFQILSQFIRTTGLPVPSAYLRFLSWVDFCNLNVGWSLSIGCAVSISFYQRLLLVTMVPIGVSLLLYASYMRLVRKHRQLLKSMGLQASLPQSGTVQEHSESGGEETGSQELSPETFVEGSGGLSEPAGVSNGSLDRQHTDESINIRMTSHRHNNTSSLSLANGEIFDIAHANYVHWRAFLIVTFLVLTTASSTVFQTFPCEDINYNGVPGSFLRADYSVDCNLDKHRAYTVFAGFMVVLYPIGIPLLYIYLLRQDRDAIRQSAIERGEVHHNLQLGDAASTSEDVSSLSTPGGNLGGCAEGAGKEPSVMSTCRSSFLWDMYSVERYYWEVAECVRRILLTGIIVFMYPGSATQAAVSCIFAVALLAAALIFKPHKDKFDRAQYRNGCIIIFLSLYVALLYRVNVTNSQHTAISALIILLNLMIVIAPLHYMWRIWRESKEVED